MPARSHIPPAAHRWHSPRNSGKPPTRGLPAPAQTEKKPPSHCPGRPGPEHSHRYGEVHPPRIPFSDKTPPLGQIPDIHTSLE